MNILVIGGTGLLGSHEGLVHRELGVGLTEKELAGPLPSAR